jgi:P-type Ca2+ transporter type 2C
MRGLAEARAMAFTTLVFSEIFRVLAARSPGRLFWEVGAFTNLKLIAVVAASVLLQIGLMAVPATVQLFALSTFTPAHIAIAIALGLVPVSAWEVAKLARRGPRPRLARLMHFGR